jgi:tagaturonate epimerase
MEITEMDKLKFKEQILSYGSRHNIPQKKYLFGKEEIDVYPKSVREIENVIFFIAREKKNKFLFLYYEKTSSKICSQFEGLVLVPADQNNYFIKKCSLNTYNRKALQNIFPFTNAVVIGLENSFGFGDRLGLANPAHLRTVLKSDFKPILAQQSIRELTRTNRTPAEVMDAAVWAVFQEGYEKGFGADADHLKTIDDIDLMVENGFTMFTFDPSEFVVNEADHISETELDKSINNLNWKGLQSNIKDLSTEYLDKEYILSETLIIKSDLISLKKALVKYGNAIAHIKKLYDHLVTKYPNFESEVEISVDETESVTTPFEHFFFVKELNRLGVKFISLAPRFIGDFEKGIDYKGDLDLFKQEYLKHLAITKYFGNYKISLHSGSDKFSVYKVIGSIKGAYTHIKTAGTSYLEALKVMAIKEPNFFREILDYCTALYEQEKKTYHVSADLKKIKTGNDYTDEELEPLFYDDNVRQVLHVTFGRILTDKTTNGEYKFKDRLLNYLKTYEETYYEIIEIHFHKHLDPFE